MLSLASVAFADANTFDTSNETIVFNEDTNPLGKVTIKENDNGSITVSQYNGSEVQTEYIVFPGSGFYEVKDSGDSTMVITSTKAKGRYEANGIEPMAVIHYEPWGTIRYEDEFAPWEARLEIDLFMDTVVNPNGEFNLLKEYSNLAALIAYLASCIVGANFIVSALSKLIGNSLIEKGLVKVLASGAVLLVGNMLTLDVSVTEYYIKAVPGDWSEIDGKTKYYDGGAISRVTSNSSLFKNIVFDQEWNENDWRNATFGRILFYEVFGIERLATEWILSN